MGATSISALLNPAVNELLGFASPNVALVLGATIIGPLDEEPAKGIALVIVFALSYLVARRFGIRMFDGVTNGIV